MTRLLPWLLFLLGLWEFGDIAALFTPGFGPIPLFLWSHILAGLILMLAGAGTALTRRPSAARLLRWLSAAAGLWLVVASLFLFGPPASHPGLWNDLIVGVLAILLALISIFAARRSAHEESRHVN